MAPCKRLIKFQPLGVSLHLYVIYIAQFVYRHTMLNKHISSSSSSSCTMLSTGLPGRKHTGPMAALPGSSDRDDSTSTSVFMWAYHHPACTVLLYRSIFGDGSGVPRTSDDVIEHSQLTSVSWKCCCLPTNNSSPALGPVHNTL